MIGGDDGFGDLDARQIDSFLLDHHGQQRMRQALLQLRFADRDQQPLGVRGTFSNGGPPLCNSALGLMGQYLPDPIFRKLKLQTCRDQSQFAFLTIISRAGEIDIGRVPD